MGNKLHLLRRRKNKNKAGEDFILEDYEIYDQFTLDRQPSIIHYNREILVSKIKSDPFKEYKVIKNIGEGSFGKVDLVEHLITGKIRAMKVIQKKNMAQQNNEASVLNELNILKKIDHQNVVRVYEFFSDADNYYLITEYCEGGDLYESVKDKRLSEVQVACIMYQILSALNHLHKMKIMHRDLKPENILVYKQEEDGLYRVKICDFGTSHLFQFGDTEKIIMGSSYYIAPEVLNRNYDFKCDLWSCGVIMYVLLTKKVPFAGQGDKEVRRSIIKRRYNSDPLKSYSQYIQELIQALLEKNPEKRINAETALTYQLFKVYKCKDTINKIDLKNMNVYIENIKKYKKGNAFKETVISYLIHNCDLSEIGEILKLFNKFDSDQKGKIAFMEFYNGLCEITNEKLNQDDVREIFLNVDTNKNNYIEQEEFVKAAVDKKMFLNENMIRFAFNFFDPSKNGLITLDDINLLFKDSCEKDADLPTELKKILDSIDTNKNGEIDFEEFSKFMKNFLEQL